MMTMWEEASKTEILGVQVYSYGLFAALGAALALCALALLLKKARWKPGTAALTGALSLALGLVMSRLLFGLLDQGLGRAMPFWAMPDLTTGGFSMIGALLGACMGALLAARITKQNAARLLDLLAPAFLLFVVCERMGEGCVENFGVSRYLTEELLQGTFLTIGSDGEWYLATYRLEAAAALILALILLWDLRRERRGGDTFLLFLILFGASQTVMESLRFDNHMHYTFVGLQQVLSIILMGSGLIALYALRRKSQERLSWKALLTLPAAGLMVFGFLYAINHDAGTLVLSVLFSAVTAAYAVALLLVKKNRLGKTAVAVIPLMVALGLSLEFSIDRSQMNRLLIYFLYIVALGVPAYLGVRLRGEE